MLAIEVLQRLKQRCSGGKLPKDAESLKAELEALFSANDVPEGHSEWRQRHTHKAAYKALTKSWVAAGCVFIIRKKKDPQKTIMCHWNKTKIQTAELSLKSVLSPQKSASPPAVGSFTTAQMISSVDALEAVVRADAVLRELSPFEELTLVVVEVSGTP